MTEPTAQPPNAIPLIPVDIGSEIPLKIADLMSIDDDLEFARDCAAAYIARAFVDGQPVKSTDEAQALVNRALWSAGIIAYRRVFTTSRQNKEPRTPRFDLRPLLDALLTPAQQEAHKEVREIATHHVAHHDSDRTLVKVLAFLDPPPYPRNLEELAAFTVNWNASPCPDAERFVEICNALIAYTKNEVKTLLDNLYNEMRQQDVDHLYELAETQRQQTQKLLDDYAEELHRRGQDPPPQP